MADSTIELTAGQPTRDANTVDLFPYFAQILGVDDTGKLQMPAGGIPAGYMYANQYGTAAPTSSVGDWLKKNQTAVLAASAGLVFLALATRGRR